MTSCTCTPALCGTVALATWSPEESVVSHLAIGFSDRASGFAATTGQDAAAVFLPAEAKVVATSQHPMDNGWVVGEGEGGCVAYPEDVSLILLL